MIQRHNGQVDAKFDVSTLAHISDGYSSGTLDQVQSRRILSYAFILASHAALCNCVKVALHTDADHSLHCKFRMHAQSA